jgi:hypothetical protein
MAVYYAVENEELLFAEGKRVGEATLKEMQSLAHDIEAELILGDKDKKGDYE